MNHPVKILGTIEYRERCSHLKTGRLLIGFSNDTHYILNSADREEMMYWFTCVGAGSPEFLVVCLVPL